MVKKLKGSEVFIKQKNQFRFVSFLTAQSLCWTLISIFYFALFKSEYNEAPVLFQHTSYDILNNFQDSNFRIHIKYYVQLWPLIKNDLLSHFFHISYQNSKFSWQKMNMILENQVLQIVKFSKYVNYEKRVSKMIFFNEKKPRKIPINFVMEK